MCSLLQNLKWRQAVSPGRHRGTNDNSRPHPPVDARGYVQQQERSKRNNRNRITCPPICYHLERVGLSKQAVSHQGQYPDDRARDRRNQHGQSESPDIPQGAELGIDPPPSAQDGCRSDVSNVQGNCSWKSAPGKDWAVVVHHGRNQRGNKHHCRISQPAPQQQRQGQSHWQVPTWSSRPRL